MATPKSDPKRLPRSWEAYNLAAEEAHRRAVPRCPECEEAFQPHRLLKHMRQCCLGRFESTAAAISDFIEVCTHNTRTDDPHMTLFKAYDGDVNYEGSPNKRLEAARKRVQDREAQEKAEQEAQKVLEHPAE